MRTFTIATLPGDGIGPEIIREGVKVIEAVEEGFDSFKLNFDYYDAGAAFYRDTGVIIAKEVEQAMDSADAIFLGAMGLPEVTLPDGTETQGIIINGTRKRLNLFAGVRPIRLMPNVQSPLKGKDKIDFVIVRESSEGLFASFMSGANVYDKVYADTMIITREGTEKVTDYAFRLSEKRNGRPSDGKKVVTCVDKSNNFTSQAFFRKIYNEVAEKYPEIGRDYSYVDAININLILHPENYDVLVSENIFGDIISDMAATLVGGMGMAPSGDIGYDHAMFQPAHGSAPTLAGKNVANPIATILSGAMMLEWLGNKFGVEDMVKASEIITKAVDQVLINGHLTRDIGGDTSTSDFGDYTVEEIRKLI
ncbi:MAG: isocitrate/isopropylmalate dehydrogenase family protein [Solobacterium sp.]|nr:isocitrate/isopropylmalate dehydrogenase family protein [Solobacterium sp.]